MVANLEAPILAVVPTSGLSDRHNHPSAEFSYGIVADGIARVDVRAVDGVHRALIGGNAYLWVENEPNTGNFITRVTATGPGSHVTSLPIAPSRLGAMGLVERSAPGPTRIDARIAHPAIGWYERREKRGLSIDQAKLTPQQREQLKRFDKGFTRLVKPDPLSNLVVGLSGHLCLLVVGGGTTCSKPRDFFGSGSLNVSLFSPDGQSFFVAGAAPDGVARIELFTSDGVRQRVPLKDNLFTAIVGAQQGARVVGYDSRGRVVAMQTFGGFGQIAPPAGAFLHLRAAVTAVGPNGATGTIRVGPVVHRLRCWKATFSTGQSQTGCKEEFPTGPFTDVDSVQPAGRDLFVIGHVRAPVASVRLRFADGSSADAKPVDGMYLFAIPSSQLSPTRQLAFVIGYNARGKRVQRQGVLFKTSG
jgi:hypothetical protein